MNAEEIIGQYPQLLNGSLRTNPRMCFMCFQPIPSKKAMGITNAYRLVACDRCYEQQYKEDLK